MIYLVDIDPGNWRLGLKVAKEQENEDYGIVNYKKIQFWTFSLPKSIKYIVLINV